MTHVKKFISRPRVATAFIVDTVVASGILYALNKKILPPKYAIPFIAATLVVTVLGNIWLLKWAKKRLSTLGAYVFMVLLGALVISGIYVANKGYDALNHIAGRTTKTIQISAIVLEESSKQSEQDMANATLFSSNLDQKYAEHIKNSSGASSISNAETYPALISGLYDKKHEIILIDEAYRGIVNDTYANFDKSTRTIKTYTFTEQNTASKKLFDGDRPFSLYISGIDVYGDISRVSRSDVNMVATVDPKNKRILLTNIPRDSYVPIALGGQGQKDKLTHAGIYGVDSSVKTIEELLDTQIAGYVRVNFTTLVELVDEVGGISVENPKAFTSADNKRFAAGRISMDGASALSYSRERYGLAGGDNDRGLNQQRVITAIFSKVASPEMLRNYQGILNVMSKSIQTNVSSDDLTKFVNLQLNYGGAWDIQSQAISGQGKTGGLESYAMPGKELYMLVLDQKSLDQAKTRIQNIAQ